MLGSASVKLLWQPCPILWHHGAICEPRPAACSPACGAPPWHGGLSPPPGEARGARRPRPPGACPTCSPRPAPRCAGSCSAGARPIGGLLVLHCRQCPVPHTAGQRVAHRTRPWLNPRVAQQLSPCKLAGSPSWWALQLPGWPAGDGSCGNVSMDSQRLAALHLQSPRAGSCRQPRRTPAWNPMWRNPLRARHSPGSQCRFPDHAQNRARR
mmetsp:Transcript_27303/g.78662  ORF Transcript_27303/g.78662 Transcript_27303/m.78662 type:complete len:211 (-) Transcript_27303:558-1190(-)